MVDNATQQQPAQPAAVSKDATNVFESVDVMNTAPTSMALTDARGRMHTLIPGQTKKLDLPKGEVEFMRSPDMKDSKLRISGMFEEDNDENKARAEAVKGARERVRGFAASDRTQNDKDAAADKAAADREAAAQSNKKK